ncbi:MAG TPA: hypothetical protein VMW63_07570 [Methanoregulaceae archaeon]|nr:hypothetical protein [Methanoregulaceae archaeon]
MAEKSQNPSVLRLTAAVILGIFVGFFLFFVVALVIGVFNDMAGMNVTVSTDIAENIGSAILLAVLIILCTAGFVWKVYTTPPSTEETEE